MNNTLLQLFRQESENQAGVLDGGLLVLERDPAHAGQLEACMRAAHSLKGAARVVGVDVGVRVAHAMEDVFVAAQGGKLRLDRDGIDVLLAATDLLRRLGEHPEIPVEDEVAGMVRRLKVLLQAPVPTAAVDAAAGAPAMPAAAVTAEADEPAEEGGQRLIRVSADRINALLDASGKALVGTLRLQYFGDSLLRLRRQQARVRRALDGLHEAAPQVTADPRARTLLADLREQIVECQHQLDAHLEAFDVFKWDSAQRVQAVHDAALASRMRPFDDVLGGRERMVRDLARSLGKRVRLEVVGHATPVDRDVLERLDAPLTHLLRNAVDHGIEDPATRVAAGKPEEGYISLSASHRAGMLHLELRDDGGGVDLEALRAEVVQRRFASAATAAHLSDAELLSFLFLPGFSMREEVTDVSGRGVGLDVVQHDLRRMRGHVRVEAREGEGCTFFLEVPLTLSMVRSLLVKIGGEAYAFPLGQIERMLRVDPAEIVELEGRAHFWCEDRHVGLVAATQLLQLQPAAQAGEEISVVVLRDGEALHGVVVEGFVGERMLAVVPLDPRIGKLKDVSAGALLDDGSPVLILDVEDLIASIDKLLLEGRLTALGHKSDAAVAHRQRVLVVEDSLTVRELQRKLLVAHGYDVEVAVDGMDGWNTLRGGEFDLLITDIDMPRMDGIELVQLLRREARFQSLPVMILSYKDREEDRLRGLDAGADYYLAKSSYQDEGLLQAVRMLLGREGA